jgi:MoxR-like ATPase
MPAPRTYQRLIDSIEQVILGKREAVEVVVAALLARGHVLLEDVPGVGKTMLARALARSVHLDFRRVQCTPDLLPSDLTGVSVYDPRELSFSFRKGPLFCNVLLVDEVNRATPRTQSAMLEAMQERQVTMDGESHALPVPFFLIATQNPIELAGTFPLPEAQLDRFLARITIGYPDDLTEERIMAAHRGRDPLGAVEAVVNPAELVAAQEEAKQVFVHDAVLAYMQQLVAATRTHEHVAYGASPRGAIALMELCQALTHIRGEAFVTPDCAKELAVAVLAHRIVVKPRSRVQGVDGRAVVSEVLLRVEPPVELGPEG